jgi:HEAT repeat protein
MPVDEHLKARAKLRHSIKALGDGDARAVEPVVAALRDDSGLREFAMRELAKIGDAAVEPLVAALEDEDSGLREFAVKELAKIGDAAVKPLVAALGDADSDIRQFAATALGELGDPRALEPLVAALGDEDIRWTAATALGELGDPRALEPLVAALGDEDASVRWRAAMALGELGDARAVEPLLRALEDEDELLRGSAATALGELGDARAVGPLMAALEDEEENRVEEEFSASPPWWAGVSPKPGSRFLEPLEALLIRAAPETSEEALRTLARLRGWDREYVWRDYMTMGGGREEIKVIQRHTVPVDCSQVRRLAQEELARRGVHETSPD